MATAVPIKWVITHGNLEISLHRPDISDGSWVVQSGLTDLPDGGRIRLPGTLTEAEAVDRAKALAQALWMFRQETSVARIKLQRAVAAARNGQTDALEALSQGGES